MGTGDDFALRKFGRAHVGVGSFTTFAHFRMSASPRKRPFSGQSIMAAMCQEKTHALQQMASLFNNLVGGEEQFVRNRQPKNLCGLEIDDQLEFGGL
jgi:hypothetical protein